MHTLILVAALVSIPHPVATDAFRPAPGPQDHVALASGNGGFFAAWEHRVTPLAGSGDVVGARITHEGLVRDRDGAIPLTPSWVSDSSPSVVWNGANYVAVFTRGPQPWPYGLKAVELSPDGAIVRDAEFVAPRDVQFVDVAFNGSVYLVAWVQDQQSQARAVVLDRTLTPITEELLLGEGVIGEIAAASNGTSFGIAFRTRAGSFFTEISAGGMAGARIEVADDAAGLDIASDGQQYVVFAGDEVVVPGGLRVPLPEGQGQAIGWDGAHYVAAWTANDRVWTAELDAALRVTREPSRITAQESVQRDPAVSGRLVAWSEAPLANRFLSDIHAAFIGGAPFLVSTSLADQRAADAIWADGNLAMLWHEGDGVAASLRFGRMTPAGELLDGEGIALPAADDARLAWNGDVFAIVTVRDEHRIDVQLLDADGAAAGPPIPVGEGTSPRIASDGAGFQIVYARSGPALLATVHLSAAGALGEERDVPGFYPPGPSGYRLPRAIVWTGSDYVVLHAEYYGKYSSTYAVNATHVTASGETGVTRVITRGENIGGGAVPFVAANRGEVLYVWNLLNDVYVQHGDDGTPELYASDASAEFAGFDGIRFVVVLLNADGTRTLVRGSERTELERLPGTVYAAGDHRVALVEQRAIAPIPNLRDLAVQRLSVRIVGGTKRRAL